MNSSGQNNQADDYKAIAESARKIRMEEHGPDSLPPLPLSTGTDLDKWATLFELERAYSENDVTLRGRIQSRI